MLQSSTTLPWKQWVVVRKKTYQTKAWNLVDKRKELILFRLVVNGEEPLNLYDHPELEDGKN